MKGAQTREKFVKTANILFQRHGFHGVGLSRLIKESGAPKGSFYFHFPGGKEELALAAIEKSRMDVMQLLQFAEGRASSVGQYIVAIGEGLESWITQSGFAEGCPVASFTLELATSSQEIATTCERAYADWVGAIAQFLQKQGVAEKRSKRLATLILTSFEGAVVMSRAYRTVGPIRSVFEELSDLIGDQA